MTKRKRMKARLVFALALVQASVVLGQAPSGFTSKGRVGQSALADLGSKPLVVSYDLSDDGRTVALLVVASSKVGAPLWLLTVDSTTNKVVSRTELDAFTFPASGFAVQVLFAGNQHYLLVQDLQQIRVFDANSLKLVRTIAGPATQMPLFVIVASAADVALCAFGSPALPEVGVHTTPARVRIVELSSGKLLSEWASEDVPQAISAKGDLVAISSPRVQKGILPLEIVDSKGSRVAEVDGGFSFRKVTDPSKPLGRVRGVFVGDKQILLSPDGNVDATGHPSGDCMLLVSIANQRVQEAIKAPRFEPTGEMAISRDQHTLLSVSWYVPARVARSPEKAIPSSSSPEALVFRIGSSPRMEASIPIPDSGLNFSGWLEARRPRVSSDGSVVAVAQNNGITILTRKP